jgi:hypothetical protein
MEGRAPVARLVAGRRLDLDHVRAVVGENLRAIGTAEHAREIDHAQTRHRSRDIGRFIEGLQSKGMIRKSVQRFSEKIMPKQYGT